MNGIVKAFEVSLEHEPRAFASIDTCGVLVLYLNTIEYIMPEDAPFTSIEEIIEELVIHEILHVLMGVDEDETIDSWHMILCNDRPQKGCGLCNCFWRSQTDLLRLDTSSNRTYPTIGQMMIATTLPMLPKLLDWVDST